MKKPILLLFICLLLLSSLAAGAAPARDLTEDAKEMQELIAEIQPLLDRISTAIFKHSDAPPLAVEQAASSLDLSAVEHAPEQEDAGDNIGLHVYDLQLGEDQLVLLGDAFHLTGIRSTAFEAPEDSLLWLGNLQLNFTPDAAAGFLLQSFTLRHRYAETAYVDFYMKDRLELRYPEIFIQVSGLDSPFHAVQGEGKATITIAHYEGSLLDLEADYRAADEGQGQFKTREDGRLEYAAPGVFAQALQETDGSCLVLELRFPPEDSMEYSLIWQFLKNSFVVYSEAVG